MRPPSCLTPGPARGYPQVRLVVTVQEIFDPPVPRHGLRVGTGLSPTGGGLPLAVASHWVASPSGCGLPLAGPSPTG